MGEIRKELSIKIADEIKKSNKLKELSRDEKLDFIKSRELYKQADKLSDKIYFLRNLDKALKRKAD